MRVLLVIPVAIAYTFLSKGEDPCACTGDNVGVEQKYGDDYGKECRAWDKDQCGEWWGYEKTGPWCCQEWCYVRETCKGSQPSQIAAGLHYLYADSPNSGCRTDTEDAQTCPYLETKYPGGGIGVPNLNGKPCRQGFHKVTGPMGNKFCAPTLGELRGCVSAVDCEPNEICEGEGTKEGGLCTNNAKNSIHPKILDATCLSSVDCHPGFVCHGPGPNGRNNCVMENRKSIGCQGSLDCPKGMSCKGEGYDANVAAGTKLPVGAICVAPPRYPEYRETIDFNATRDFVPEDAEVVQH
mmetsp:Transcript_10514/g.23160  ORF Transcript_10514/g.23160 Transcript_10514/m.23160 type:complete len:296 (-) Transcript_10514:39-926(-)|eukprot:CAMPEP_0204262386 /NCGR_PEP_ID=MMETSP0468-20130131/7641_1 /ASSEMBLY_ACC=CAM_ASM_000383 /TAXON_ID=2969 /ORGANISM="Oxyrrhis marina" /LENGTH=295 /DNA_ID=CAMNT_0051237049 /DNA_START=122 /DNA_END=1009 /DNA_ORIENTATION=+